MSAAGNYKPGDVLGGKYTVLETLGRGSSGVTYKVLFSRALNMSDLVLNSAMILNQVCLSGSG